MCVLVFAYPDHLFFILIGPLPVVMLKRLTVYIMIPVFWSFACCYAKEINSIYMMITGFKKKGVLKKLVEFTGIGCRGVEHTKMWVKPK